jgi:hypothetical protein
MRDDDIWKGDEMLTALKSRDGTYGKCGFMSGAAAMGPRPPTSSV